MVKYLWDDSLALESYLESYRLRIKIQEKIIPVCWVSLLTSMSLNPSSNLVMAPEPARAAQLDALSLQVVATLLNPPVTMTPLSPSKPLLKMIIKFALQSWSCLSFIHYALHLSYYAEVKLLLQLLTLIANRPSMDTYRSAILIFITRISHKPIRFSTEGSNDYLRNADNIFIFDTLHYIPISIKMLISIRNSTLSDSSCFQVEQITSRNDFIKVRK